MNGQVDGGDTPSVHFFHPVRLALAHDCWTFAGRNYVTKCRLTCWSKSSADDVDANLFWHAPILGSAATRVGFGYGPLPKFGPILMFGNKFFQPRRGAAENVANLLGDRLPASAEAVQNLSGIPRLSSLDS
jgi:hypothetical protein